MDSVLEAFTSIDSSRNFTRVIIGSYMVSIILVKGEAGHEIAMTDDPGMKRDFDIVPKHGWIKSFRLLKKWFCQNMLRLGDNHGCTWWEIRSVGIWQPISPTEGQISLPVFAF
jgi:hypothetical protein